jgi:hypothetical protein
MSPVLRSAEAAERRFLLNYRNHPWPRPISLRRNRGNHPPLASLRPAPILHRPAPILHRRALILQPVVTQRRRPARSPRPPESMHSPLALILLALILPASR